VVPSGGRVNGVSNVGVVIYGAYIKYVLDIYGNINIILVKMKLNIYKLY